MRKGATWHTIRRRCCCAKEGQIYFNNNYSITVNFEIFLQLWPNGGRAYFTLSMIVQFNWIKDQSATETFKKWTIRYRYVKSAEYSLLPTTTPKAKVIPRKFDWTLWLNQRPAMERFVERYSIKALQISARKSIGNLLIMVWLVLITLAITLLAKAIFGGRPTIRRGNGDEWSRVEISSHQRDANPPAPSTPRNNKCLCFSNSCYVQSAILTEIQICK